MHYMCELDCVGSRVSIVLSSTLYKGKEQNWCDFSPSHSFCELLSVFPFNIWELVSAGAQCCSTAWVLTLHFCECVLARVMRHN